MKITKRFKLAWSAFKGDFLFPVDQRVTYKVSRYHEWYQQCGFEIDEKHIHNKEHEVRRMKHTLLQSLIDNEYVWTVEPRYPSMQAREAYNVRLSFWVPEEKVKPKPTTSPATSPQQGEE